MYRFYPTVKWHKRYPGKARILEEIHKLWLRYGLQSYTSFETPVTSVTRANSKWIINEDAARYGYFDGVIPAIGTCGELKMPSLPDLETFAGQYCHSSQMDKVKVQDKDVILIGGGASAIEVVEHAVAMGARSISIVSRVSAILSRAWPFIIEDRLLSPFFPRAAVEYLTKYPRLNLACQSQKWIIPRNIIVDILLSLNVTGEETWLSFVPEAMLRWLFYRDLKDLAPQNKGFFEGTPMCNDQILSQIRSGRCRWLPADLLKVNDKGLLINHRSPSVRKGGPGTRMEVKGDLIVFATGFERPDMHFLPKEVFESDFSPPAWYLQTFPTEHAEICAINSTYVNALGTVGNVHIGMYTRLLLTFLLAPSTKPTTAQMRRWVSLVGTIKQKAPQRAFDYFTYSELILWFVSVVLFRPRRWTWALFIITGLFSPRHAS